jgi:hypothetical protein
VAKKKGNESHGHAKTVKVITSQEKETAKEQQGSFKTQ